MSLFSGPLRRRRIGYEIEDVTCGINRAMASNLGILASELRNALQMYLEWLYNMCSRGVMLPACRDERSYISTLAGFIQGFYMAQCAEVPSVQFARRGHYLEIQILSDTGETVLTLYIDYRYKPPHVSVML